MNDPQANSEDPLLSVQNLTRRSSKGAVLIENVSLTISAGDRLAVVGETGSGKTVLLRCLAMLDPCEVELRWKGDLVADANVPEYRSRVIYLPQASPGQEGTVEDNLQSPFSLEIHQSREYSQQETLVRLQRFRKQETFLNRQFSELSGGERQMLALLRALQLEPEILLLDEASSALDPANELVFEQLVEEWLTGANDRRAVIWVSHDESQRRRVSDREFRLEPSAVRESPI